MKGKTNIKNIRISEFDYFLPEERIAKYPLPERDASKLLVYQKGSISEQKFSDLPGILSQNDLLVFNNTRVIPARLKFQKSTGANIEIFCLEPVDPAEYHTAFQSKECTWKCIVGNLKKWKGEPLEKQLMIDNTSVTLTAIKLEDCKTHQNIHFSWNDPSRSFSDMISLAGVTPIPPYLHRESENIDKDRYQTIYSRIQGSVAAPTAGLHFTETLLDNLKKLGVSLTELTLHVGAGTFKPVQTDSILDHQMHTEFIQVSAETLKELIRKYPHIVSVGTTTLRTLETLYWLGVKIKRGETGNENIFHLSQWDPYESESSLSYPESLQFILQYLQTNGLSELFAYTQIMIVPGYKLKSIKALITNFHQPKSTLLLLVSSITGDNWKNIYTYAMEHDFRFLSYGDSSILFNED